MKISATFKNNDPEAAYSDLVIQETDNGITLSIGYHDFLLTQEQFSDMQEILNYMYARRPTEDIEG